ncbi:MAG TPA: LuxR C-terminal-related transcriptional regulator [Clostridia bacterium]|nr:LuxR C-terminal-related transcriptional regulator [Clostridia bacterium]
MSAANFENDKYIPTPLPEICAPRNDLLKLFDRAADKRLTAVCAPAGYGKTVSALLWIQCSRRKSVWVGLDEYDNAPFVFYKMFCNGIRSVQPDNEKMDEILNSKTFYSSPVEHTINLLAEFAQDGQSYALILDDLHTMTNKQILKSLPYILKRMPHSFDILLLSRYSMPEELEELMSSRGCCCITAKELAFSNHEIRDYYNALGFSITQTQAQQVLDTTGGWVIGINAMAQNEIFNAVQGGGQILENYIHKNIWEKWDLELREFMLATSIADEMDAELCGMLTGKKNAENILDKLVAQNLFVVKTSHSTYRYHHLFSDFLRSKLKERPDIDVLGLTLKVADFYFERHEVFKALAYYVNAENQDGINRCFYQLNSGYLDFSVEEWLNFFTFFVFDKLSEDFIRNNISLVIEASWANYLNGNAQAALRYIDLMNDYIASEENLHKMEEEDLLGFICTIRFADFRKGICEYTEDFSEWIKTLPCQGQDQINIYTPTLTQNFPYMHRSFCDCSEIFLDMDNSFWTIKKVFGTLFREEVDVYCSSTRAGLYYELNQLDKAYDNIMLAQSQIRGSLRFEMKFCVFIQLSDILNAMGKPADSRNVREQFSKLMKEEKALYLNPNFLAVDTKYKLRNADLEAAKEWLEQLFVTNDEQLRFYKLYQYFTTARAYIVLSEQDKAMEYLEKLKKLGLDYYRPLDVAEAGVLQAAVKWATDFKKEAVQILEEVLLAMQPYRAVRIIADEGAAVLPILKKIAVKVDKADYEGQLDGRYVNQVILCAYEVSKRQKGITAYLNEKQVKLSKQQKYILTLLAQGYKNAEIVDMTGLTINTIKAHTKIIYMKLNVNRAADAVLEAKRLGIIES